MEASPALPSYQAAADFLEKKTGSGARLVGFTILRAAMIAPAFLIVGTPVKRSIVGSLAASGIISVFTVLRIRKAQALMAAQAKAAASGAGPSTP